VLWLFLLWVLLPCVGGMMRVARLAVDRAITLAKTDRPALAIGGLATVLVGIVVGLPVVRQAEIGEDMAHTAYYLGGIATDNGEPYLALSHYEAALEADPTNVRYQYRIARIYASQDRDEEALEVLNQINTAEPYYLPPYLTRGTILRKLGRLDEAEQVYRTALRYGPRYELGWNNLGNVLQDQGRPGDAFDAFAKALDLKPAFQTALRGMGRNAKAAGKQSEYRVYLEKAKRAGLGGEWLARELEAAR